MNIAANIRISARSLARNRGVTLVMVLSLALGYAASAVILAVVNAYLVRSMPYPEASRLYHVMYSPPGQAEPAGMTMLDWTSVADVVEVADSTAEARFYFAPAGYMLEGRGLLVAPSGLDLLSVRVVIGRSFSGPDFRSASEPVALIGHALWRDQFNSDPNIVGRQFRASLNDQNGAAETFRIIGVLPPDFRWFRDYVRGVTDIVVPIRSPMRTYMVRLREGVPANIAAQRITDAAKLVATSVPSNWTGVQLESVQQRYVKEVRPILFGVSAAAGLTLILVCANVAVLMLLRSLRHQLEIAVRMALGAGRWQIVRMMSIEACLVSAAAIAIGLALTKLVLALLAPAIEMQLGRPAPGGTSSISIDPTVLLFSGGIGVVIAFALSLVPLGEGQSLTGALRRNARSGRATRSTSRFRSSLVAVEVAGSLALLVGCGLMLRSMVNLLHTDLGFQTEHILRSRLVVPSRTYPDAPSLLGFYERFLNRLSDISNAPVALTNYPPFYEPIRHPVEITSGRVDKTVGVVAVSASYFGLFEIPVVQGRPFVSADRIGGEPVAIVSETLAAKLWPRQNAVGQRLRTAEQTPIASPLTTWRTVVGVVRDVRQTYRDVDLQDIYIPFFQAPNQYAPLYIRTDQTAAFWLPNLRNTIGAIDPDVLVTEVNPLAGDADKQLAGARFLTATFTGFAAFAVLLASLGIYGVTGYATQQREHEIAIRTALGATRSSIVRLFLKDGGLMLLGGVLGGLLSALWISRIIESQIHGIEPLDISTLAATAVLTVSIGLLSMWWPARLAALKNPITVLKDG